MSSKLLDRLLQLGQGSADRSGELLVPSNDRIQQGIAGPVGVQCSQLALEQHEILEISIALGIPTTIQGLPLLGMTDRDQDQAREQRRIVTRLNKWVSSSYVPIKDKKIETF